MSSGSHARSFDKLRMSGGGNPGRSGWLPIVTLDHLWLILPLAFVFSYASAIPITHTDFYYHLLNGRLMFEQGGWLQREVVTYAPAQEPLLNQPWLAQLVYYGLYRLGGYELLALWHALVITTTFVALRQVALCLCRSTRLAALAVLLGLLLGATNFAMRPQSMAFSLFAILLWLLERHTASDRRLWSVVPLTAVWANIHGSFILAPALVAAYLAGALIEAHFRPTRSVRRLGLALAGTGLATLVSPLGPDVYRYAGSIVANPVIRTTIVEWRPPSPDSLTGLLFFTSLPLAALGLALGRRSLKPAHLLLLLGLLALAVTAQRNVVWWGLAMPPILLGNFGFWILDFGLPRASATGASTSVLGARASRPPVLSGETPALPGKEMFPTPSINRIGLNPKSKIQNPKSKTGLPVLNAALVAVVLLVALLGLPWIKPHNPLLAPTLRTVVDPERPEGVAGFFERQQLGGRVLSRMEWGGYLAWRLWPRSQPFLDARIEEHPARVWQDYFTIMGASVGWEALVDRYGADFLVVDPTYSAALTTALGQSPAWRELYRDRQAIVFERVK